ncbi:hypothetical protein OG245_29430 [Streptomyces sp. NBC_01116]|uniref:hypothetical protein n=1 Tax=Streptomyces sp. NBC_01116 TaxID=2903752 RepID=UPI0032463B57
MVYTARAKQLKDMVYAAMGDVAVVAGEDHRHALGRRDPQQIAQPPYRLPYRMTPSQ